MKTIFFKKMVPFMVVLATGIGGAFLTTSMQSAKDSATYLNGYADSNNGPCTVPVTCSNLNGQACRVSYPNGQIAKKIEDCDTMLFRPN